MKDLFSFLRLFWPPTVIRIIVRGAQEVARFRALYNREPSKHEWAEIAKRIEREILGQ